MSANIVFSNNQSKCSFLDGFVEASVETPADGLNGECVVHYSGQYRSYTMTVKLVNGVREGKAVIVNGSVPYMRLEYKRGSLTGIVERMNSSGSVELRGHLVNGVEDGLFEEFDNNKVVWSGYYGNGRRKDMDEDGTMGRSGGLSSERVSSIVVVPSSLTNSPQSIEELRIGSNSYNNVERLQLSGLNRLKWIVIGDNCFNYVTSFEVNNLNELESITIGKTSFIQSPIQGYKLYEIVLQWTPNILYTMEYDNRIPEECSFRITDCSKLERILIGSESFSGYRSFELRNLSHLESIQFDDSVFQDAKSVVFEGANKD